MRQQRFSSREEALRYLKQFPREKAEIHPTVIFMTKKIKLGRKISIGPYSVIGSIGFDFEMMPDGIRQQVTHIGGVEIGNDVAIGPCNCIERGTIDSTKIGNNTKLDHFVLIGHNSVIGNNCLFAAGAIIGGSVEIGENTLVGLNATIKHHVKIGSNVVIGSGSNVIQDVEDNVTVVGNPARIIERKKHGW